LSGSGVKELKKGDILFREGDPADAMYVLKKGRLLVVKAKGSKEIILADLAPGEMTGEMGFFDNKPRSATARTVEDSQVIVLPFGALHAQFKTFPEWLKAMVKTINSHLRTANQRIKNLEQGQSSEEEMFAPHTISRLCAIISLIGYKAGEKSEEGLVIPSGQLRNYCIQIFQQPTHKMQKLMEVLNGLRIAKTEDLGEGKQKITLLNHKLLSDFVDWYNEYLFTEEEKRVTIEEKDLPILRALVFYGKKQTPNDKGLVTVSLTEIQNNSMADLNFLVRVNDADVFAEKGLTQEKVSGEGGALSMSFDLKPLENLLPFWELIYSLKRVPPR
jgi:CRP-like cAMP-binding protein